MRGVSICAYTAEDQEKDKQETHTHVVIGPSNGFVLHQGPITNPVVSFVPSANVNVTLPCWYCDEPEAGHTAVASAWKDWKCVDAPVWSRGTDTTCEAERTVSNAVALWKGGNAN